MSRINGLRKRDRFISMTVNSMTNKQIEQALEPYKTKYLAKWFDLHPFYLKKVLSGKSKRSAKFENKLNEFLKTHLWTLK